MCRHAIRRRALALSLGCGLFEIFRRLQSHAFTLKRAFWLQPSHRVPAPGRGRGRREVQGGSPSGLVDSHGSVRRSALGEGRVVEGRRGRIVRDSREAIRWRRDDARIHRGKDRRMVRSRQRAQGSASKVARAAESPDVKGAGCRIARAAGQARAPEGGDLVRCSGRVVRGQDPGCPTVGDGDARGGDQDGHRRWRRPRAVGGDLRHPQRRGGRRVSTR